MNEGVEILLAEPRGFCAGVDRAIEIVERRYGGTTLFLPSEAGTWSTNVAVRDGAIVVVEAEKGDIWQIVLPQPRSASEAAVIALPNQ